MLKYKNTLKQELVWINVASQVINTVPIKVEENLTEMYELLQVTPELNNTKLLFLSIQLQVKLAQLNQMLMIDYLVSTTTTKNLASKLITSKLKRARSKRNKKSQKKHLRTQIKKTDFISLLINFRQTHGVLGFWGFGVWYISPVKFRCAGL